MSAIDYLHTTPQDSYEASMGVDDASQHGSATVARGVLFTVFCLIGGGMIALRVWPSIQFLFAP